jgi:hypothetical protein
MRPSTPLDSKVCATAFFKCTIVLCDCSSSLSDGVVLLVEEDMLCLVAGSLLRVGTRWTRVVLTRGGGEEREREEVGFV